MPAVRLHRPGKSVPGRVSDRELLGLSRDFSLAGGHGREQLDVPFGDGWMSEDGIA